MTNNKLGKINIFDFCDVQGLDGSDKFVIIKMYKNSEEKEYKNWYDLLIKDFPNLIKKDFFYNQSETKDSKVKK